MTDVEQSSGQSPDLRKGSIAHRRETTPHQGAVDWPLGPDETPLPLPIRFGPGATSWPPETIAWCQRCDRPIRHGQPYMPRIPFLVSSAGGFDHQWCPPRLEVVRGG